MHDVFISYHRADSALATRIAAGLERVGLSVFRDVESIVSGNSWDAQITEALEQSRAVVVLLSSRSKRSAWVQSEVTQALESKKLVVPVLLDSEATDNWVWPLVSNRAALRLDSRASNFNSEIEGLVRELRLAIKGVEPPEPLALSTDNSAPPILSVEKKVYFWLAVVIAIVSSILGGLVTWWLSR